MDAPPFFSEPTWKQTWPSAAGLVQLDDAPPAFDKAPWTTMNTSGAGLTQLRKPGDPVSRSGLGDAPICTGANSHHCQEPDA